MPRKTIDVEVDGKRRTIDADIPDGATPEDIEGAVHQYLTTEDKQKGSSPQQVNAPEQAGPVSSFLHSALNQINPLPALQRYLGEGPPALQQMHEAEQGNLPSGPQGNIMGEAGQPAMTAAHQAIDHDPAGAIGSLVGGYAAPPAIAKGIGLGIKAAPAIAAGGKGAITGGAKTMVEHPVGTLGAMFGGHYLGPGGEIIGPLLGGARLLKGMYEGAQEGLDTLRGKPTSFTGQHQYKPPSVGDMRSAEESTAPKPVKPPKVTGYKSTPEEATPTTKVVKSPRVTGYKKAEETTPSKALTTPPRIKPRSQTGAPEEEGEIVHNEPLKSSPRPVASPVATSDAGLDVRRSENAVEKSTAARHKVAHNIADHLHKTGITSEDLNTLEADKSKWGEFWKMTGDIAGSKQKNYSPSQMTIDAARDALSEMERKVKQVGQEGARDTTILMEKIGKSLNLGQ